MGQTNSDSRGWVSRILVAVCCPSVHLLSCRRPRVCNGRNLPVDLSQDWDAALTLMSDLRSSGRHKQLYGRSDPTFLAIYGQNNLDTKVVKYVLKRAELLLIGLLSNIIVEILRSARHPYTS